jgi:hypothetical protein
MNWVSFQKSTDYETMTLCFFQNEKAGLYVFLLSRNKYCPETCPSVLSKTNPTRNMSSCLLLKMQTTVACCSASFTNPQNGVTCLPVCSQSSRQPRHVSLFSPETTKTQSHVFRLLQNLSYNQDQQLVSYVFSVSFQAITMTSYFFSSARALDTTTPHVSKFQSKATMAPPVFQNTMDTIGWLWTPKMPVLTELCYSLLLKKHDTQHEMFCRSAC